MRRKLVVSCGGVMMALALRANAADPPAPAKPREGRGFIIGGGLGPSRINFGGAEGLVLVTGESIGTIPIGGGQSLDRRTGRVLPLALVPADAEGVVPIPARQDGAALSIQLGWSFSRRLAILADFDINGGWGDSFNQVVGAGVLRYSPTPRLWLQAGPATGDLSYGFSTRSVAQDVAGTGAGFLVAGGLVVLQKPRLLLDLQARYGTLWFDQFRGTNLSVQIGIMRRRS